MISVYLPQRVNARAQAMVLKPTVFFFMRISQTRGSLAGGLTISLEMGNVFLT